MTTVALIVVMDTANGIGCRNDMPWRGKVPADMKRFRELTTGHAVIMGHATYRSMGGALKNRQNIVLSRQDMSLPDAGVCRSLEEGISAAKILFPKTEDEVFILGGGQVYAEALRKGLVDRLYVTEINHAFVCDTFFPNIDLAQWRLVGDPVEVPIGPEPNTTKHNAYGMHFMTLERITSTS